MTSVALSVAIVSILVAASSARAAARGWALSCWAVSSRLLWLDDVHAPKQMLLRPLVPG